MRIFSIFMFVCLSFLATAQNGGTGISTYSAAADAAPGWTPSTTLGDYSSRLAFNIATFEWWEYDAGWIEKEFLNVNTAFVQGGNSFGANAVLGTNDAFSLNFETNGTIHMTLSSGGLLSLDDSRLLISGQTAINSAGAAQWTLSDPNILQNASAWLNNTNGDLEFITSGATPTLTLASDGGTVTVDGILTVNPNGTAAGNTGIINFAELVANGTNTIGLRAPDAITASFGLTLPDALPTANGQVIQFNTDGTSSFATSANTNVMTSANTADASYTQDLGGFTQTWNSTAVSPLMSWDGTNGMIGIGTATPNEQVEITGNLRLPATTATSGIVYRDGDRFLHNYGTQNTFLGQLAGNTTLTNQGNTAIGYNSLVAATSASDNTGVGRNTLSSINVGVQNVAIGSGALQNAEASRNVAVGYNAMNAHTSSNFNVAVGYQAMASSTTSSGNTAVGSEALNALTTAQNNTAFGFRALYVNTNSQNTAFGSEAMIANTGGLKNVAMGRTAMYSNVGGSNNVGIGYQAMYFNVNASQNVTIGESSMYNNVSGAQNTAVGNRAGSSIVSSSKNTAIGAEALAVADSTVSYTVSSIDITTETITMGAAHGLTAGTYVTLRLSSTATIPTGLSDLFMSPFTASGTNDFVCDCDLTSVGSGTITATLQKVITNSIAVGYQSTADASNQISFGNDNVTQLKANNLRIDLATASTSGDILVHNGTQYTPSSIRVGKSRNVAAAQATTTITDDGRLIIWYEVADITGAGTIIQLPDPAASLGEVIIKIKFLAIDDAQSATITTASGTANIENAGILSTSVTISGTQDYSEFTFNLKNSNDTWLGGS